MDPGLLKYLSPLGWEHFNPIGGYRWKGSFIVRFLTGPRSASNNAASDYQDSKERSLCAHEGLVDILLSCELTSSLL